MKVLIYKKSLFNMVTCALQASTRQARVDERSYHKTTNLIPIVVTRLCLFLWMKIINN